MSAKIRDAEGLLRVIPKPGEQILPKDGETNVLITSALPYCNNVPHLGESANCQIGSRARNRRTLYICGTDEYGTATETQALKEGLTPRELCDKYNVLHVETYKWFELSFDHFGRTSTPLHTEICQEIYSNLSKNGYLEKQIKEQTYCQGCSKFLADRFVEGTCPHCGADTHTITTRSSANMYIKLDALQLRTEEWIRRSWKEGKWSPNAVINADGELVDARLKGGLRPSPVTRDLTWGVPVPKTGGADDEEMDGKFDACIGYPSITANYTSEWKQWWFNQQNVHLYQFMGKDNVYFHTIYFPSTQIGDGRPWTTLYHLSTTEYLNYEGGKFSKSHNRGVFGPAAKETGIPTSVWRYYLLSTRPETADSMFSWADCIAANNNVLLNNFGNFVNRALKFVASQYDSIIPDGGDAPGPLSPNDDIDADFISEVNGHLKDYIDALESVKLRLGLQTVMLLSARGNIYLQASGLNKTLMTENPKRCAQVVSRAVNLIYVLSALVFPYMPTTAESMLEQLNAPARSIPDVLAHDILAGHRIGAPEHLFKRIDEKMADVWRDKFGGIKPSATSLEAGADSTHVAPGMSKRKAAAAKKAADKTAVTTEDTGSKSAEVLAWEQKVAEQGQVVRELKTRTPKTPELEKEVAVAVDELKKLKEELAALQKR
ncbi:methionyl-tRNA synthetase [Amylocystis lapponica]|nr:methionyl-tRNA synthetase [Amylocystis lapponica]